VIQTGRDRLEWSEVDSRRVKIMLGTAGAGAILAMGVVSIATGDVNAAVPQPVPYKVGATGQTVTETTAPSEPETSKAVPPITTAPYTIPPGEPQ
jgi:hypothetical protein